MTLDPGERAALVARYRAGHAEVLLALESATDADPGARPGPGGRRRCGRLTPPLGGPQNRRRLT
jgi:hypothetical protein